MLELYLTTKPCDLNSAASLPVTVHHEHLLHAQLTDNPACARLPKVALQKHCCIVALPTVNMALHLNCAVYLQVLDINKRDTVLTLTSGGCNSLNLLLHGAGHVVSVDCNPAQSALLELKATAIRSVCSRHTAKQAHSCYAICKFVKLLRGSVCSMPCLLMPMLSCVCCSPC